ncbi:hypothetical protein NG791_12900 [Laspinema sp. D1]|uniref:hypothetical protein n=1 Tax=Laspinema palackyanum TaxID=3231601 RepID=UPI0034753CE5|nr:hypothetical protein [Laspinema sp. D2b]
MPRGGLGWGSSGAIATSGPLPLARGGLGWGSSCAIARHEERGWSSLHTGAIAPKSARRGGKRSYPVGNRPRGTPP